jgi:hypothetical protein
MTMSDEQEVAHEGFAELLADAEEQCRRADKAKALETKHELANNVWPFLLELAKTTNTRFEEIESSIEEYLLEEGNIIYSDLAEPLFGLIAVAKNMAATILTGDMNELKWQQLRKDAAVMQRTVDILEPLAAQAVVADSGDVDDDDEDEDDGDDDPDGGEEVAAEEEKEPA